MKTLALGVFVTIAALTTAAAIFVAGFSGFGAADRGQAATWNLSVPVSLAGVVPCANDGRGETVTLSGAIHLMGSTSTNARGDIAFVFLANPQGVTGVGKTTGLKYLGAGATQTQGVYTAKTGITGQTFINNFLLLSQGRAPNLVLHSSIFLSFYPDGTIGVNAFNGFLSCS